jgi:hypothetical protein
MGKGILLYEQVYNDLTAAVARAKQACRKRPLKPSTIVAEDKKHQRGRPKGSKDTVPRKKTQKSNVHTVISAPSGSSDCRSITDMNQIFCAGFDQVAPYEAADCFPTETTIFLGVSHSPTALPQDPACWELPLPC